MNASCSKHARDGHAYKDKWSSIIIDFTKIFDFIVGIRQNQDYWAMNIQIKTNFRLFYNFGRRLYEMIHEFLGKQPIFNAPHM